MSRTLVQAQRICAAGLIVLGTIDFVFTASALFLMILADLAFYHPTYLTTSFRVSLVQLPLGLGVLARDNRAYRLTRFYLGATLLYLVISLLQGHLSFHNVILSLFYGLALAVLCHSPQLAVRAEMGA